MRSWRSIPYAGAFDSAISSRASRTGREMGEGIGAVFWQKNERSGARVPGRIKLLEQAGQQENSGGRFGENREGREDGGEGQAPEPERPEGEEDQGPGEERRRDQAEAENERRAEERKHPQARLLETHRAPPARREPGRKGQDARILDDESGHDEGGQEDGCGQSDGYEGLEPQERGRGRLRRDGRSQEARAPGAPRRDREGDRDPPPAVEHGDGRRRSELGEDEALGRERPGPEKRGVLEIPAQVDPEAEGRDESEERGQGEAPRASDGGVGVGGGRRQEGGRGKQRGRERGHDRGLPAEARPVPGEKVFPHDRELGPTPRRKGERHRAAARFGREGFEAPRVPAGPKRGPPRGLGERRLLEADGREGDARVEDAHEAESGRQRERERAGGRSQERGEYPAERGEERERRRPEGPGSERGEQPPERGQGSPARVGHGGENARPESHGEHSEGASCHGEDRDFRCPSGGRRKRVPTRLREGESQIVEVDRGQQQPESEAGENRGAISATP